MQMVRNCVVKNCVAKNFVAKLKSYTCITEMSPEILGLQGQQSTFHLCGTAHGPRAPFPIPDYGLGGRL